MANKKVEEQLKADLLSLVSHELKTPLMGVLNALRLLNSDLDLNAEQKKWADLALKSAENLRQVVTELVDLAQLEMHTLKCHLKPVSLSKLSLGLESKLTKTLKKEGREAQLVFDHEFSDQPYLLDMNRFQDVCEKLLSNALKFSPKNSKIYIQFNETDSGFEFITQNESTQKYQSDLQNLVKVFSQQEPILSRSNEGLGGALAISDQVMKAHFGCLKIDYKQNKFIAKIFIPKLVGKALLLKLIESKIFEGDLDQTQFGLLAIKSKVKLSSNSLESLRSQSQEALFRSRDSVVSVPEASSVVLIVEDCTAKDFESMSNRLKSSFRSFKNLSFKSVHYPSNGFSPVEVLNNLF